ncbi:MAG: hypothetical protein KBS99_08325 [Prevotellaceae bacterium]|nr:hypothetical protein [Candidatus Colivivens caballi]
MKQTILRILLNAWLLPTRLSARQIERHAIDNAEGMAVWVVALLIFAIIRHYI